MGKWQNSRSVASVATQAAADHRPILAELPAAQMIGIARGPGMGREIEKAIQQARIVDEMLPDPVRLRGGEPAVVVCEKLLRRRRTAKPSARRFEDGSERFFELARVTHS